jgi:transposase-like protein
MFRIKNSMKFVVSKDREAVAKGLKTIYQASYARGGRRQLAGVLSGLGREVSDDQ